MVPKLISVLLSLALLLGLVGCVRTSSVSYVQPISVAAGDPAPSEGSAPEEVSRQGAADPEAQAAAALSDSPNASELPGFAADFATSRSVVFSAFQAAFQRQQQSQPEAVPSAIPESAYDVSSEALYRRDSDTQPLSAEPESVYALSPDTSPLAPEQSAQDAAVMEDDLTCRLDRDQVLISLGLETVSVLSLPQTLEDIPCQAQKLLLSEGILAVLLQREDARTSALLYDLSDPTQPLFLGCSSLDGSLSLAQFRDGMLLLCTDYAPQAEALALPAFYEGTRRTELQPGQILMPESLEEPVFLLCARFEAGTGQCLDCVAAAGTSQAVTVLTDGRLVFSWAGAEVEQEVTTQSVYTVTTTATQTKAGLALVALEHQRWSVLAACEVRGIPQLVSLDGNGVICVVSLVTDTQKEVYYDPSYGWTIEPEEIREESSLLYLLDERFACLSRLELAQEAPQVLGLYGNTLYYITPSDGILRAAGTSDAAQPIAAPLAEVDSFTDFAILKEGCAAGLVPAEEEGLLELVVLNISNPSRITRKYLSEPLFASDTRLVRCQVAGKEGSLIALQEGTTLWLLHCSNIFAPTAEARLELTVAVSQVLGSEHLLCLSGSAGSLLLDLPEMTDSLS